MKSTNDIIINRIGLNRINIMDTKYKLSSIYDYTTSDPLYNKFQVNHIIDKNSDKDIIKNTNSYRSILNNNPTQIKNNDSYRSILNNNPTQIKNNNNDLNKVDNNDYDICAICLDNIDNNPTYNKFCNCRVKYHDNCLNDALRFTGKCPICKKKDESIIVQNIVNDDHLLFENSDDLSIHPYLNNCGCINCRIRAIINTILMIFILYAIFIITVRLFKNNRKYALLLIGIIISIVFVIYLLR